MRRAALLPLLILPLAACTSSSPAPVTAPPASTPAAPVTTAVASPKPTPLAEVEPVRLEPQLYGIPSTETVLVRVTRSAGSAKLPAFEAPRYRILIACMGGGQLKVYGEGRNIGQVASTPCDGVPYAGQVLTELTHQQLRVQASAAQRWVLSVTRMA